MQAWGVTRAFEKKLMALTEGIGTAGAGDSAYEAVKERAQQHLHPHAAGNTAAQSDFEVLSNQQLTTACGTSLKTDDSSVLKRCSHRAYSYIALADCHNSANAETMCQSISAWVLRQVVHIHGNLEVWMFQLV